MIISLTLTEAALPKEDDAIKKRMRHVKMIIGQYLWSWEYESCVGVGTEFTDAAKALSEIPFVGRKALIPVRKFEATP